MEKSKCSGCSACYNICPTSAIIMKENPEGFLYPEINNNLCINCNRCKSVCQLYNTNNLFNKNKRIYFAARQKDKIEVYNSSSGGVIALIAKYVLSKSGYFCGATFKNGKLFHKIIDNYEDFKYMRGSKYFQSDIGDVYKQVKNKLSENKLFVFVGTPCQVSGLKLFLGKEYENLYLIDLICHGVPSKKVFNKYLSDNNLLGLIDECSLLTMRDKQFGWHKYVFTLQNPTKNFSDILTNTSFGKAFAHNLCLRESCHACLFTTVSRPGDIMVGDYWGIQRLSNELDDNKGWNLVSLNNKGMNLFDNIKAELEYYKSNEDISLQPNLLQPTPKHPNRKIFFEKLDNSNINELVDSLLDKNKNVGILNFYWENNNYGAILTAYALNKYLNNIGYNAYNINYLPTIAAGNLSTSNFEQFRNKYIPQTYKCESSFDFESLNNYIGNFIVGSDQVFRYSFVRNENDVYYLKFVNDENKKIAYSASFGIDSFEADNIETLRVGNLLSRFNSLGIRESSGVKMCNNKFKLPATHVLDPVFLLEEEEWLKICNNNKDIYKCVHYIINDELSTDLADKLKSSKNIRWKLNVEDWLAIIKNSEFVVTDSFHAVCFCLILKKRFICVVHPQSPYERILSLFEMLHIPTSNIIIGAQNFKLEEVINNKLDYEQIYMYLQKEKLNSENFIQNALTSENNSINCSNNKYFLLKEYLLSSKKFSNFKYKLYDFLHICTIGKMRKSFNEKYNKQKFLKEKLRSLEPMFKE